MAMDMDDGGYLGAYRRFFIDFVEKMNPADQLPVKMAGQDVTEDEVVGEIIDMTLQYLNQKYCPPSLQSHLVHVVIEDMLIKRRQQPETCGFKPKDNTYAPLKLMQAVIEKVSEMCRRYLENSRLALLPPPPSIPLPIVTVCAIKNSRRKMEDRHVVLHDLNVIFNKKEECANYYAVFDGHAGQDAAVYSAAHLHQYLCNSVYYPTDMERALRDAFVTTDAYFVQKSKKYNLSCGATAVCAVIFKQRLYVAWAGDSQAALVKRGNVNQLVNPHRPDRNDERDRVEKMGGAVVYYGMWRVNGYLAVSRAIGDAQYKPCVTADPEIRCVMLDGTEDFLIIACDGLWDFVNEKSAAMVVYQQVCRDPYNYDAVSQRLVDYSKQQGSTDNITVIIVFLTPPNQIAARSFQSHPLLADVHLDNMDDDNRYLSNANGQYEIQTSFVKQAQNHSNGSNFNDETSEFVYGKSSSGKHENGTVEYDNEEDDDDFGPETDVDAVDDAAEINPLVNVSRELFPEKDSTDDFREDNIVDEDSSVSPSATKPHQNELTAEPENVGDSEDSDDEWNYFKADPNKQKENNSSELSELKAQSESTDFKLFNEEVSQFQQEEIFVSEKEQQQQLEDNEIDSCSDSEVESEQEVNSNELIETVISGIEVPTNAPTVDDNSEDMDFQLNPDAAEFVPVSPVIPSRLLDQPIAGSPLKQMTMMDDIRLPSPKEFTEEANHRPHEVDGKEDMINSSNGDFSANNDGVEFIDKPKLQFNLDESEISSTRAEFGDESTASFLTTADYPKTDANDGMDGSFTDSCPGTCDNECMMMSFGPGAFNPLSNAVDLNAVHDLSDTDLCDQDDQSSPKETQLQGNEREIGEYIKHEKREVYSPDVHPELAHLISPESDQPPHSVAFPDHEDKDLLGTSSPVPKSNSHVDEFHDEVEIVTSEVAAMNLKNEKLSDVLDEKELDTFETPKVTSDIEDTNSIQQLTHLDDISPASQVSLMDVDENSSTGLEFNSSLQHCSEKIAEIPSLKPEQIQEQYQGANLMSDDNAELSSTIPDLIQSNKENVFKIEHSSPLRSEIFENPLHNNSILNPATNDNMSYTLNDDADDEVKVTLDNDDTPFSPQFDVPTGDPCSRSLSTTPEPQEISEKILEHQLNVQPQVPNMDTSLKVSEFREDQYTHLENEMIHLTNGNATEAEIQAPEVAIPEPVAATTATVAVKSKTTSKAPLKTATKAVASKTTNKLSPTSPTKALNSVSSRPKSSPNTKKTATTPTTARLKPTDNVPKPSVTTDKSPTAKLAAKSSRLNTAPKPKTTSLKSSSAIIERKSNGVVAANGEVKSATVKSAALKPKTTMANNVATKPLVKSTMTSTRPTTTTITKSKPATIGSATSKVATKTSTTVTSTMTNAARPKTAPATLGVTKTRATNTKKSPILDKQIKETANKQISSSRTSTTTTATRTSRTSNSSTTATVTSSATSVKRITSTATTKKPPPTTRMSAKSATAISKTTAKNNSVKAKIQNGVCEMKETKTNTITPTAAITTTNEPEIPQKDDAPPVSTTDSQLLITAD